jgi:hypothetical protein
MTSVFIVALALALHQSSFSAGPFTVDPKILSDIVLEAPEDQAARDYLGIRETETFTLPQVAAKTLIIEVFSMYCPHCQGDAPEVNKLYQLIQKDPALKDKIKMLGIGTGNTTFEVNLFKKKFHVPFPLFPDEDFALQKACSQKIRTPLFIVVKPESKGGLKPLILHVGKIDDADKFLQRIIHPKKR